MKHFHSGTVRQFYQINIFNLGGVLEIAKKMFNMSLNMFKMDVTTNSTTT